MSNAIPAPATTAAPAASALTIMAPRPPGGAPCRPERSSQTGIRAPAAAPVMPGVVTVVSTPDCSPPQVAPARLNLPEAGQAAVKRPGLNQYGQGRAEAAETARCD